MQMKVTSLRNFAALLLIILLASCAAMQVAYNNSGILIKLWVKSHFDLKGTQSADFNARLAKVQRWHRTQELPHYEKISRQVGAHLSRHITPDDVHATFEAIRERYKALAKTVAEEGSPVLLTLTPEQLQHLQAQFDEDNEKFIKKHRMNASTEKQLDRKIKWAKDKFEEWIGNLSSDQEQIIETAIREMPILTEMQLTDRQKNQKEFIALVKSHRDKRSLQVALQDFFENIEAHRAQAYSHAMQKTEARLTQLIVQVDKSLSAKQRSYASNRFAKLAQDFHELNLSQ